MRVCDSEWLWYLVIQLFVHEFIFIIFSTCLSFVSFVLHNYKELLSICNTKKISNPRYPTSILHKCITLYHSKWKVKDLYSNKSLISLCVVDYMDNKSPYLTTWVNYMDNKAFSSIKDQIFSDIYHEIPFNNFL